MNKLIEKWITFFVSVVYYTFLQELIDSNVAV